MVKYQGSKQRYVGEIQRAFIGLGTDYYSLPFWECCCGSAVVSEYLGKSANLVDVGPWGMFWEILNKHGRDVLEFAQQLPPSQYENWVKISAESPIPGNEIAKAITFLALQREAFNGKAVEVMANYWRVPGLGKQFSYEAFMSALARACDLRIASVHRRDLNTFTIERAANVYLDPDYEDTTGYSTRTVDVRSFVRRHSHCNLVVSHHAKFDGEWDKIIDISSKGRKNFARDTSEYLHIKRRS